ncbi:MAG: DNA polymerase III subunit delta, partial [Alphaproteobacteria bacterium]
GGLVHERAAALVRHVVADTADPFRVAELGPAEIKDDPARLADEAAALAFTGGRRVVRLRPASDAQADVLMRFLADPVGDALVVVEAAELGPRSRLRRLFEDADNAAALPCYRDEGAALRRVIEDMLAERGLGAEPAACDFLESVLGGDRMATRSELDKLATYMGSECRVALADAEACVGDAAALTLDGVAIAAAGGDLAGLERGLARAWLEGIAPVAVLRAMARHLRHLHRAAGLVARGDSPSAAVRAFRPPLHFKLAAALSDQLGRWPREQAARAMEIVVDAEAACKTTGAPAEVLCARALMRVALAAQR